MSYILIVDDDQMMAKTLSDMVTLLDWETQVVNSPRSAIELIRRKRPGLILLDLNMPGVNGLEVCRYIQREPSSAGTPVVFVTAEDDPGIKQQAKEAGAMDYLVKPVDFDRLEQLLKKISPASPGIIPAVKPQPPAPKPPAPVSPLPAAQPADPPVPVAKPVSLSTPAPAPTQAAPVTPPPAMKPNTPSTPETPRPITQPDQTKSQ